MENNSHEFSLSIRTPVDNLLDIKELYLPLIRQAMPEFYSAHKAELIPFLEQNIGYCPDELSFLRLMKDYVWSRNFKDKDILLAKLDGMVMYLLENGACKKKEDSTYEEQYVRNSGGIRKMRKPNRWSFDSDA